MKNTLYDIKRYDIAEEKTSEPREIAIEFIQNDA